MSSNHKNTEWASYVSRALVAWEALAGGWLRARRRLLVVHYDTLVRRTNHTLHHILHFLNVSVTEEQIKCAIEHKEGIYRRKKKYQDFDPFTPEMYAAEASARRRVSALLARHARHDRHDRYDQHDRQDRSDRHAWRT